MILMNWWMVIFFVCVLVVVLKFWEKMFEVGEFAWFGLGGGFANMGVSKNNGIPKSSILIGFGTIIFTIHFGGTHIFGNIHMFCVDVFLFWWFLSDKGGANG